MITIGEVLSLQFKGIPDIFFVISFSLLCIFIVLVFMLIKNRQKSRKTVLGMLLLEYLFLMFCSTVLCREVQQEAHNLELIPFWNYDKVLLSNNSFDYWEVILNIFLYSPIGFLLGCIFKRIFPVLLICVSLSIFTEVMQFVLHKGLCEFDDVLHNTLGGILGYFSSVGIIRGVQYIISKNNQ